MYTNPIMLMIIYIYVFCCFSDVIKEMPEGNEGAGGGGGCLVLQRL